MVQPFSKISLEKDTLRHFGNLYFEQLKHFMLLEQGLPNLLHHWGEGVCERVVDIYVKDVAFAFPIKICPNSATL